MLKRAEYVLQLTEKIRTDEVFKEILYKIDYAEEEWYNEDFINDSNNILEGKVDKVMSYFSYICYLNSKKLISKDEFKFFEYRISRILTNWNVQDYFYNLYHFANSQNSQFSFVYLLKYGESKNFFENDFYDKESYIYNKKYHKYLNW